MRRIKSWATVPCQACGSASRSCFPGSAFFDGIDDRNGQLHTAHLPLHHSLRQQNFRFSERHGQGSAEHVCD